MTSWLHVPRVGKEGPKERPLFFQTTGATYAGDFLGYLYAKMYAGERSLSVYDRSSQISSTYGIIEKTFEKAPNVVFVDSVLPSSITLSGPSNRLIEFLVSVKSDDMIEGATAAWRWTPAMLETIEATIKADGLGGPFDIGVHLTKEVFASTYVVAVKKLTEVLGDSVNIFVLADAPELIDEFKKRAYKSWKITHSPVAPELRRPSSRAAIQAYTNQMAGLHIMRSLPIVVSALSNPTGKFLFLSNRKAFKSLDTNTFTFF